MSRRRKRLAVAVTGHGYGHATRTAAVTRELRALRPELELTVVTTAPARLFAGGPGLPVTHIERAYEPGTLQKNCFETDIVGTCAAYLEHARVRPRWIEAEVSFLRRGGFAGVLADVPSIPLAAADRLGLPSAGLWSFTWDWILEPVFLGAADPTGALRQLLDEMHAAYETAGLHLRLPFSPRQPLLPRIEAAPLVGRKSDVDPGQTRERIGLDSRDDGPVALVAMGGWDCSRWAAIDVRGCEGWRFVVVGDVPLNTRARVHRLPFELEEGFAFQDLVRAADVVLSKPGYGIASECVVNGTPLLGVERREFREIPELLRDLREYGPFDELSLDEFFAGAWEEPLMRRVAEPRRWRQVEGDGAHAVALRLCRHFNL